MSRLSSSLLALLALASTGNCTDSDDSPVIRVAWNISLDGEVVDCESVNAAWVDMSAGRDTFRFPCADLFGTSEPVPEGFYDPHLYLLTENETILDDTFTDTVEVDADGVSAADGFHLRSGEPEICEADAYDEDHDGLAGCDDADCDDAADCAGPDEDCGAEGDEDGDGDADCDDADCAGEPACEEEETCTAAPVTIAAVYTRGGAGGAAYNADFVLLKNRGATDYDLTNHSLQTATLLLDSWEVFALPAESIPADGYYLVQIGMAASQGAALPTPDASLGVSGLSDAAPLAVALMPDVTALGACPGTAIDLFSVGQATCAEGTTVAAPGADGPTEWYARGADGCPDTDVNDADFAVETAGTPATSASAPVDCACP